MKLDLLSYNNKRLFYIRINQIDGNAINNNFHFILKCLIFILILLKKI